MKRLIIRWWPETLEMTDIERAQDQLFSPGRSAREKYAALVVGRPGWGALLKYEFVQQISQNVAGAVDGTSSLARMSC
jgi:hypothetical protein